MTRVAAAPAQALGGRATSTPCSTPLPFAIEEPDLGPLAGRWDLEEHACSSVAAFVEMLRDRACREAVEHRQAAVLDSRLIRLAPAAASTGFAA